MKKLIIIIATGIFFYLITISCKKPGEIITGGGTGTGNGSGNGSGIGSGGGNTNTNKPPVADAGPDQTITILTSYTTTSLNGNNSHDSTGMSLQYFWKQVSGPSNSFLQTPAQKECRVYNINIPGVYTFELKVWNNNGTAYDTIAVALATPSYCQSERLEVPATLTFLATMPEQIQNPEIIAAGDKLLIPAWFNNATGIISNKIYVFDRITQIWTTIQASQARVGAVTIAAGNKVFFAGGMDTWDGNYTTTSIVDIYDITTNTWSVSNLSEARGYCRAVVSGNRIFFAGGIKNNNILSNKIDIYNLETNSWTSAALPSGARVVGTAIRALDKVLFCGGYTKYEDETGFGNTFTTPTASIDVYDNNSGQWSVSTMQVNKGSFAAISVNEKVYLAGGVVDNAVTFHVEELNVNTMTSSGSCLHQPMVSYDSKSSAIKNNRIVFFTYSPYFGIERNKFDIYNIQTGVWSVGILPIDLVPYGVFSAIVSVNNEIYTVIGTKLYRMNL